MKIYVKVIHFLVSRVFFLNRDYFEFSPSAGCVLFIHQLCNCLFTNLVTNILSLLGMSVVTDGSNDTRSVTIITY